MFAGFLSTPDAQIGRVLDLEESGQLDNTVIVVISRQRRQWRGGPNGSVNRSSSSAAISTPSRTACGSTTNSASITYNHYRSAGRWPSTRPQAVQAFTPPTRGRHRDTAIVSWPKPGSPPTVRSAIASTSPMSPTVYELLGIEPPQTVGGVPQRPLREPVSLRRAGRDSGADTGKATQFYSMLGTRGIWHDGLVRQHRARSQPRQVGPLRRRPLGTVQHRGRPQPVAPTCPPNTEKLEETQRRCGSPGGEVQRAARWATSTSSETFTGSSRR